MHFFLSKQDQKQILITAKTTKWYSKQIHVLEKNRKDAAI
jgi:hypothetical protein